MTHQRQHPGIRSGDQLRFRERAADQMRNAFGTWTFLGGCLLFILAWIYVVQHHMLPIDNDQLTILNLVLSTFAALQGGIILLAAKRSDAQSTELAHHDFAVNQQSLAQIQENTRITRETAARTEKLAAHVEKILAHLGIEEH